MINIIVQQIVMDRRPHDNSEDFASTYGMAVGTVFQNFRDIERLRVVEKEAEELKEQYELVISEKDQLQNEIQKLRIVPSQLEIETQKQRNIHLKQENDSLRDVLKTSKENIAMLQEKLALAENDEKKSSSETLVLSNDWKVSKRLSDAKV
jgi:predicted RNase H-like nuclease (RuvC/YqgF family)